MNLLKAIGLTFVITCATAAPSLAEGSCNPGDMNGPPCAATSTEPTALGETQTPPAANSTDLGTLAEIALHSLLAL